MLEDERYERWYLLLALLYTASRHSGSRARFEAPGTLGLLERRVYPLRGGRSARNCEEQLPPPYIHFAIPRISAENSKRAPLHPWDEGSRLGKYHRRGSSVGSVVCPIR